MKSFKISIIIIICLFLQLSELYAQNDYVITKNNDTIFCKIRTNGFNGRKQFKGDKSEKFITIKPDSVIQYFIAGDTATYVLKTLPDKKYATYVQWVERGRLNLYRYEFQVSASATQTLTETYWYANKLNDPPIQIKHYSTSIVGLAHSQKEEKEAFINLFSDNPNLTERIVNDIKNHYDWGFIQYFIEKYNREDARINSNLWDYIITKKQDTILCKIKADPASGTYLYKVKGKNDYDKIDSTYINEFFFSFDNIRFKLKTLPGQNNSDFVRCLEKGQINLFEQIKSTREQDKRIIKYYWYVNKGAGPLIAIKTDADNNYDIRTHKDQLAAFRKIMADDKDVLGYFNYELQYVKSDTDNIIRSYIINYNKTYAENKIKK
jgi:hypothetical protein